MSEQPIAEPAPYTVVVGVSATSKSVAALRWGLAQADAVGGRLVAVRMWRMPNPQATPSGTTAARVPLHHDAEAEAARQLAADVTEALGADHTAEVRLVRGGKFKGLLRAAENADLLVIDAPRRPSVSPLLAHRLVYAASCPVVVMPPSLVGRPQGPMGRAALAAGAAMLRSVGTAGRPGYRPPMSME